jgi:hypothetical protein
MTGLGFFKGYPWQKLRRSRNFYPNRFIKKLMRSRENCSM